MAKHVFLNLVGDCTLFIAFFYIFAVPKGEVAEWSIAAVLKTVDLQGSGGSNPPFSAPEKRKPCSFAGFFVSIPLLTETHKAEQGFCLLQQGFAHVPPEHNGLSI